MAFYGWLQRQTLAGAVSSPVETFALKAKRDPDFPRGSDDYGEIRDHLVAIGAFAREVDAFREAWRGFAYAYDLALPREIESQSISSG